MKNLGATPAYIEMGGHSLFYWKINGKSDKTIIFLHGLLDEGFSMRRIVRDLLGENMNIFIFDLPGFGRSKLPRIKYLFQVDIFADLLYEAFQKMNLSNVILIGHSMGGLISQHIVLMDKEKIIEKLVLLSPGGIPHPEKDRMQDLLFPDTESRVVRLLKELYGTDSPTPGYFLRKTLVSIWNGWENNYLRENTLRRETEIFHDQKMSRIKIPTLIIAGDKDEITFPRMIRKIKKYIKGSKLVWLKGAKHAIHLERPKEIADEIRLFR